MKIRCGLVIEGQDTYVPLKSVSISVSVNGFLANVEACLKYTNTESKTLEVVYVFPMDDNSAVYKCEADIDGRHIVSEIQEKEQARETYNEAVRSGHSAVLMEEHDTAGDIFRCKLGNLPPNSDANIRFAFVTELEQQTDGSLKFVLPTVLNPRYNPSKEDGGTDEDTSFLTMNNCQYKLEFEGTVSSKQGIARVWSDMDKLATSLDKGTIDTMKISLSEVFSLTHSLSFNVMYTDCHKPQTSLGKGTQGMSESLLSKDLLMLSFYPDLSTTTRSINAEFIFIVDRSGSMSGSSIQSAKEAMLFFLKSLPVDCFFNIVSFGSSYTALFPEGSKEYGESTLKEAMALQASLEANMGGTEILRPLEFVYRKKARKDYPRQIFLLTDGGVSNANEVVALVKRNSYDSRVFTVGIGDGVSTTLVRNVAKAGGGQVEFVTGKDKLQQKVMELLKSASQPAVTDLGLDLDLPSGLQLNMMLPKDMPVIFSGQRCTLYAFLNGTVDPGVSSCGKAQLTGKVNGESFTHTMTFDVNTDAIVTSGQFIHRMAIKGVIKDLELEEKDSDGDKKREILVASTAANIMSKYTSFVGVDKEKNEKIGEAVTYYIRPPAPVRSFRLCSMPLKKKGCLPAYGMSMTCNALGAPGSFVRKGSSDEDMKTSHIRHKKIRATEEMQTECQSSIGSTKQSFHAGDMVMLQAFDGSWSWTGELAEIVGVRSDELEKKGAAFDPKVWATGVAVCWLTVKCPEERSVWEMVVMKAKDWLVKQLGGQADMDKLLKDVADSVFSA